MFYIDLYRKYLKKKKKNKNILVRKCKTYVALPRGPLTRAFKSCPWSEKRPCPEGDDEGGGVTCFT